MPKLDYAIRQDFFRIHKQIGNIDILLPNAVTYDIPVIINEVIVDQYKPVKMVEFSVNVPLPWMPEKMENMKDECIVMTVNSTVVIEITLSEIFSIDWSEEFSDFRHGRIVIDDDACDGQWTLEFVKRKSFFCLERIFITY